jgi:hypothetical protein
MVMPIAPLAPLVQVTGVVVLLTLSEQPMVTGLESKNSRPQGSVILTVMMQDVAPAGGVKVTVLLLALGENVPPQLDDHCAVKLPLDGGIE